jgi:polyferredoxin
MPLTLWVVVILLVLVFLILVLVEELQNKLFADGEKTFFQSQLTLDQLMILW